MDLWPLCVAIVLVLVLSGCQDARGAEDDDAAARARAAFDRNVASLLVENCGRCHSDADDTGFLNPSPDLYAAVLAWPELVSIARPASSRLLTQGDHRGPALTAEQASSIRRWLDLEVVARRGRGPSP